MKRDGKQLEQFVALVEEYLLPQGFEVKTNEKIYDEVDGVQLAELDITAYGKIGSTRFAWLIECRDRKTPGPRSWIEQLTTRREELQFNKVTAVSTSGFSRSAAKLARRRGIELREVVPIDASELAHWLNGSSMKTDNHAISIHGVQIEFLTDPGPAGWKAFAAACASGPTTPWLKSLASGEVFSPYERAREALIANPIWERVKAGDPVHFVRAELTFQPAEEVVFIWEDGSVKVAGIVLKLGLQTTTRDVPLSHSGAYRSSDTGSLISQVATFAPIDLDGHMMTPSVVRMVESGSVLIAFDPVTPTPGTGV